MPVFKVADRFSNTLMKKGQI